MAQAGLDEWELGTNMTIAKRLLSSSVIGGGPAGQVVLAFTPSPTGTWVVPEGVYSISVLKVNAGNDGSSGTAGSASGPGNGGLGGTIGSVFYRNDIPVTPGQEIEYRVGSLAGNARASYFGGMNSRDDWGGWTSLYIPGIFRGENGGPGSTITYESGYGGRATTGVNTSTPMDSPIALTGSQNPGTTTPQGHGSAGRTSSSTGGGGGGGGGGARQDGAQGGAGGNGRGGAIRIVWPGDVRQYPYDAA